MRSKKSTHINVSPLSIIVLLIASTGCVRYHYDVHPELLRGTGSQVWGVGVTTSGAEYQIHSFTRLNGTSDLKDIPSVTVSSGQTASWKWEVLATPSLVPSWKVWEANIRAGSRAKSDDAWTQPAATWDQAFVRASRVSEYLMGRPNVPVRVTLLLVPEGTTYKTTIVGKADSSIPLTFAFYFPISDVQEKKFDDARFSAMVYAVARTMHEYQHVLYKNGTFNVVGRGKVEQAINDESRSQCWLDSTLLSLTIGTHTVSNWQTGKSKAEHDATARKPKFEDAAVVGLQTEADTITGYLQTRGITNGEVKSSDPAALNAVLSACRAITQNPQNLAKGPYPIEKIDYIPFFPSAPTPIDKGSKSNQLDR